MRSTHRFHRAATAPAALALALFAAGPATGAVQGAAPTAITMWWIVFNHPSECAVSPCEFDDLFDPDVEASVFYATGGLTRATNPESIRLVASLYETGAGFADVDGSTSLIGGPGLLDSNEAEIHLVVRSHGQAIQGLIDEQISIFLDPGCQDLGGPNVCEDVQFAIHLAGSDVSFSDVFSFETGEPVPGARSQLIRLDGAVKVLVQTLFPE